MQRGSKGQHPYAKQFHMRVPRDGKTSFDFSAFFCGIGDARHLYASIADIGMDLQGFKPSKSQAIKVHFTLVCRSSFRLEGYSRPVDSRMTFTQHLSRET